MYRRAAAYGMLTALAMIFSYVEALIPVPVPVPGIKLGIANLVTVVCFYMYGIPTAAAVSLTRITLSALLFGNLFSFAFSMAGGLASLLAMSIGLRSGVFKTTGISILGGTAHNIGQICAAALLLETKYILSWLPALLAGGVVSGTVIGIVSALILERIKKAGVNI